VSVDIHALFKLRKPCENCPFRKIGAIDLRPGRVESIIDGLLQDDKSTFLCHKTVHNDRTGGEWHDDEDEGARYVSSGKESYCTGALIYLHKARMPNVAMRLGQAFRLFDPATLAASLDDVIDPPTG
jgi:hypothetical protein